MLAANPVWAALRCAAAQLGLTGEQDRQGCTAAIALNVQADLFYNFTQFATPAAQQFYCTVL